MANERESLTVDNILALFLVSRQIHVRDDSSGPGDHRGGGAGPFSAGDEGQSLLPKWPAVLALQQAQLHRDLLP